MKKRKVQKRSSICLTLSMVAAQTVSLFPLHVSAAELQFEGTTQIASTDYYLDAGAFLSELEIEEIYVEAGSQIQEGGQILKLTDESYQEALEYYEAAVIRAEGTLTDTQMAYEQGLLDAQYTYELAQQKAEQAEFVWEYQSQELEDTIAEHEEVLADIEERIAELETGIANGSYSQGSAGTGGTGGTGGGNGSTGGTGSRSETRPESEQQSEQESESQSETALQPGSEDQTESEPESESQTEPGSEPEFQTESGSESELQTEPESELPSESGQEQGEDGGVQGQDETVSGRIEEIKAQIEANDQLYDNILKQLGELAGVDMDSGTVTGLPAGESGGEEAAETTETAETPADQSELASWLQESITGDGNVKTNLENVQANLDSVPENVLSVIKEAYPDYQEYITLLESCISQLEADISLQQNVLAAIGESGTAGDGESEEGGQEEEGTLDTAKVQELLVQLSQAETQRSSLYGELITLYGEYITMSAEDDALPGETEDTGNTGGADSDHSGDTMTQTEQETESPREDSEQNGASERDGAENGMPGGMSGSTSGGSMPGGTSGSGMAGGISGSGMAAGGSSGGASPDGELQSETLSAEDLGLLEEDISLFGDTYDLTQIISLTEREPSDSEEAYDLIGQLEDAGTTVEEQYAELIRNQDASKLQIQYTYDSAVIDGKLAEITYRQEVQEWEETLADAESEKETLEAGKAVLDSFTDGIVTADRSGTISSVSFEAGDLLESGVPVVSYYDTDQAEVEIEVSQYDIAEIEVGDTAEVELPGAGTVSGTVTEKSPEAESGTSRTAVSYLVTVSMDNENGRISQGLSASVTIADGEGSQSEASQAEGMGEMENMSETKMEEQDEQEK